MNEHFLKESYWAAAWVRHIESYLAAPPRAGVWLSSRFGTSLKVLEIAGGSCRDSRYLASIGVDATGADFDSKTLDYLAKRFSGNPFPLRKEDAFAFSYQSKVFDLTFSNGFWVCFSKNDDIHSLIREQARITRKYLVSFVHNAMNRKNMSRFKEKAKSDALYSIRFFRPDELHDIIRASGIPYKSIAMFKFGGLVDLLYKSSIRRVYNPFSKIAPRVVPYLYNYERWSTVERIACVIELE